MVQVVNCNELNFQQNPQTHGEDVGASTPDPGSNGGAGSGLGAGRRGERCLGACRRSLHRLSAGPHRCYQGRHTQKTTLHTLSPLSLSLYLSHAYTHLYMQTHYHESQIFFFLFFTFGVT